LNKRGQLSSTEYRAMPAGIPNVNSLPTHKPQIIQNTVLLTCSLPDCSIGDSILTDGVSQIGGYTYMGAKPYG